MFMANKIWYGISGLQFDNINSLAVVRIYPGCFKKVALPNFLEYFHFG